MKRLTINLDSGPPPSLNPYVGVDLRSRCLYLALYEPLMRRNASGGLEYAAAEKVDVDPSRTVYTFRLRPHCWSNGEPVTSRHFAESWKHALTPGSFCVKADLLYLIKNGEKAKKGQLPLDAVKISTPDDRTLVVELDHPTPYFLDLTATSFLCPLPQPGNGDPACFNGPFVVGEKVLDEKLVLRKNPSYWDRDAVDLEEVCFTMVKDPMTALAMYERGELDVVGDPYSSLPFDALPALEESGRLQSKIISRIFYLLLNNETPPFHLKSFRKALAASIDRAQLTQNLLFREVPTLSSLPKTLAVAAEAKLQPPSDDPGQLFEQACKELGVSKRAFPKITLAYAELSGQKELAQFLKDQWQKKLGIEVEIVCMQWNTHVANLRTRNYQIGTLHLTTLYQDPMFYFDFFRDKQSLANYTGWENSDFKQLLAASERTTDPEERRRCLEQAELQLFDETPAIPLFTQNLQYLIRDGLDLPITDLGIYDLKRARIDRTQDCAKSGS